MKFEPPNHLLAAGCLLPPVRAGVRRGLSQPRRDHRGAGGARRALQPVRAADRQQARAASRQAVHRREPAGRELDRRRDVGDPRAARRLYADGRATPAGSPPTSACTRACPTIRSKDFAPVALIARIPEVLVVNAALPVHSLADLAKLAKATPGGLTYGSAGAGPAQHLSGVLLASVLGVPLTHVPYKGMSPAINDVAGGHIPFMFSPIPFAAPLRAAGKLRMLGVTTASGLRRSRTCRRSPRSASRRSTRCPGSCWWRRPARRRRSSSGFTGRPAPSSGSGGQGGVHQARPRGRFARRRPRS